MAKFPRRDERPIRVAQKLPGQKNDISLTGTDDLIGLSRLGNHSDRSGEHAAFATNLLSESDLISGANRNPGAGNVSSRRTVNQIYS